MNELVGVLVLWLSVTFGLPQTNELPEVRFMHSAELTAIRYGHPLTRGRADVVALYHDRTETILLGKGWDSSRAVDVSVLVHELVHHCRTRPAGSTAAPRRGRGSPMRPRPVGSPCWAGT